MEQEKEKYMLNEEGFWACWGSKLLFTLISVKVWGLIASIAISTWLLSNGETITVGSGEAAEIVTIGGITGEQWLTFNTTVWALIFGMKEIFRISDKKEKDDLKALEKQNETKIELASIVHESHLPEYVDNGKHSIKKSEEIVGEMPEKQMV